MFCEIREGSNRYKYIAEDKTFLGTERSFCPACGREVGMAEYSAETPVFTLEGGKKYPDFLRHFSRGAVFSRRAVEVFWEAGVTGIEYSPVTVENAGEDTPEYFLVNPQGFIDIDYGSAHIKKKNFCGECGQFELNRLRPCPVTMDMATWNGLDFCRLGLYPNKLIVTEKVIAAAKKVKLKGMEYAEESDILYALKNKKL